MKKINIPVSFFLAGTLFVFSACNNSDTKTIVPGSDTTKQNNGWEILFDGKTTTGWHTYGKETIGKAGKVEDSTLHLDASVKNGWQTKEGGDIVTDNEYENFHLKLEWMISKSGNSGIMIYVHEDTIKYKYPWESGPEIQVCDNENNADGKIDKAAVGNIYDLVATSSGKFVKPAGQWNKVEIIADKGKLDLYLNEEHTLSTTLWDNKWDSAISNSKFKTMPGFGTFKKGKIGLQDHGADVWFRNIIIKKL